MPLSLLVTTAHTEAMDRRDLASIVECAGLAPSVHNTQPWAFHTRPYEIDVRAERSRGLDVLDPSGRQMFISCGAAVEFARTAVHALGRECAVTLLPSNDDPDLVARLSFGGRRPETEQDSGMVDAILRRFTDRGEYAPAALAPTLVAELVKGVDERGGWLKVITEPGDRVAVIQALTAAEAAEAADPAYRDELAAWVRVGKGPDGIPTSALEIDTSPGVVNEVPLRDFTGRNQHPLPGGEGPAPAVERDTLILIGTTGDTPTDWLRAGQALGWLLLRLTVANVSSQPLGQVLDLETVRLRLSRQLGFLGHIQFLVRTGIGHGLPVTSRRGTLDTADLDSAILR
jgi:nitroreductase